MHGSRTGKGVNQEWLPESGNAKNEKKKKTTIVMGNGRSGCLAISYNAIYRKST